EHGRGLARGERREHREGGEDVAHDGLSWIVTGATAPASGWFSFRGTATRPGRVFAATAEKPGDGREYAPPRSRPLSAPRAPAGGAHVTRRLAAARHPTPLPVGAGTTTLAAAGATPCPTTSASLVPSAGSIPSAPSAVSTTGAVPTAPASAVPAARPLAAPAAAALAPRTG